MRDLLAKVNLGTPGRAKVYILDEVHMLTSQAETPAQDARGATRPCHLGARHHRAPQGVETIRSRCQVFQLTLLGADEMAEHVRWVSQDAGLDVSDEAVEHVVTPAAARSATRSRPDRVVAAGGVVEADTTTDTLAQAIAGRDVGAALAAVGDATGRGRDPRTIGEDVLACCATPSSPRWGRRLLVLSPAQADRAEQLAALMSPAAMTRAMETLGVSLVEMRQAPIPVSILRLRSSGSVARRGPLLDALSARVEQLERQLAGDAPIAAPASCAVPVPSAPEPVPTPPPTAAPAGGTGARQPLAGRSRRSVATRHRRHRLRRP